MVYVCISRKYKGIGIVSNRTDQEGISKCQVQVSKSTDAEHKVTLDSHLLYANWVSGTAPAGGKISFEIGTSLVGYGSPAKIKVKNANGKKLGSLEIKITSNRAVGEFDVPDDVDDGDQIYFEVKLSKQGLSGESDRIPAILPIRISEMKWSSDTARRGELVALSAKVKNIPDATDAVVKIYEFDRDGACDLITEMISTVENGKIKVEWEYQYFEDTDEIATEQERQQYGKGYNPPEYFFTITIEGQEFGKSDQASGLLQFKDWIELIGFDDQGNPAGGQKYKIFLADGSTKEGKLDDTGLVRLDDIPPGPYDFQIVPDENENDDSDSG